MPLITWLVFIFFSGISNAIAEETEADERFGPHLELDEMVITGTRTEKKLLETPVRTEVVTREEIEQSHARDLKEALEDVPGLILRRTHGKQGESVGMQGFDADRILILLNGERLSATAGSTVDLTQIGTADIERIEIVKGATSALYGSEAMGGVINVITRKPKKPFSLTFEIDTGTYGGKNLEEAALGGDLGAARTMADLSLVRSRWNLKLTSDLRRSEGFDLGGDLFRTDGDETLRWNLDPRIAWTPVGGGEIYLSPRYYFEDKERRSTTQVPGLGLSRRKFLETVNKWHVTVGGKIPFKNGSRLSGAVAHERLDNVSQQDVVESPQIDQQRTAIIALSRAEVQWDFPVGEMHLLTWGAVVGEETLKQEQVRDEAAGITNVQEITSGAKRENIETYLQDDIFLSDWFELLPGIRYQNDSDFGSFVAPKLNLMFKPAAFVNFRIGYGKGYRVPNLRERFFFFDHSALGYRIIGNPDLQPEESDSFQLGLEMWRGKTVHGEISLFYNRIKNLIDTRLNPEKSLATGLQIFDYQNVTRAVTQGAEFSGRFLFWRYFTFKAGYTYLWAKDTDLDKWLPQRPRHQVKAGLDFGQSDWGTNIIIRAVYQSKEFVDTQNIVTSPAWTTFDLKLNQSTGEHTTLFIGVDNITDKHRDPNRSEFDDFRPNAPRFIYAGIRIKL
ncbi:hypothetical protein MNBD_NITROSPIRAE01-1459 [hydrothermal vent metagenome]|uniref:TonB-dependent receptor n=1 Tax=hydrothermal vent metagenome TaxID=652676 RepID=A0A3B1CCF8_9ZZZZ